MSDQLTLSTPSPASMPLAAGSLLGPGPQPLALRVGGSTAHRGKVIRIRSLKCSIGSAPGCTLRLRASGVRPLHCWILRGPRGAIVRRAASDALLNGLVYQDAPLRAGDRLQIGPVELEVVACPSMAAGPRRESLSPPRNLPNSSVQAEPPPARTARIEELEACLAANNEEIARLEADAQQALQNSIVAAERADQLREALEQANVEAGEYRGELETARTLLSRYQESEPQLAQWQERVEQAEREAATAQQSLDEARQALAVAQDALNAAQRELAERSSQFTRESQAAQALVEQLRQELQQVGSQTRAQTIQMTVAMDQIRAAAEAENSPGNKARVAELEAEVARLQAEWEAARPRLDAAGKALSRLEEAEQLVAHWQTEAQRIHGENDRLQGELARADDQQSQARLAAEQEQQRQREEWEQLRSALAERDGELDAGLRRVQELQAEIKGEREAWTSELLVTKAELEDKQALLDIQAKALNEQMQQTTALQAELDQARVGLAETETALQTRQQQLADQEQALAAQAATIAQQQADLDLRLAALAEQAAMSSQPVLSPEPSANVPQFEPPGDSPSGAGGLQQTIVFQGSSAAPPVESPSANGEESDDVAAVLQELTRAGLWRRDEPTSEEEENSREFAKASPPADSASESPPVSDHGPSSPEAEEQDEQFTPPAEVEAKRPGVATPFGSPAMRPAPQPAKGSGEHHEEESIESYMARLLQRVRGDDGPSPQAAGFAIATPAPPPPQPVTPSAEAAPHEYLPRSQAPEHSTHLAAMRELANSEARSAIEVHQRRSVKQQFAGRLLAAVAVFAASIVLMVCAYELWSPIPAVASIVGLGVSLVWMGMALRRALGSMQLPQPAEGPTAEPVSAEAVGAPSTDEPTPAA